MFKILVETNLEPDLLRSTETEIYRKDWNQILIFPFKIKTLYICVIIFTSYIYNGLNISFERENWNAINSYIEENRGSKTRHLTKRKLQDYLTFEQLTLSSKQLLFSLRVNMFLCRANFPSQYRNDDLNCQICKSHLYNQQEIFDNCPYIKSNCEISELLKDTEYLDIYGSL